MAETIAANLSSGSLAPSQITAVFPHILQQNYAMISAFALYTERFRVRCYRVALRGYTKVLPSLYRTSDLPTLPNMGGPIQEALVLDVVSLRMRVPTVLGRRSD